MVLLAGCGTDVDGTAVAGERWDPCSITQDALADAGLDPDFRESWGKGIDVPDWSLCIFRGPALQATYFFNVKSSDVHVISEARANQSNLDGRDLEIAGRDAYRYTTSNSRSITDCNIAVEVDNGVVVFTVNSMGTAPIGSDPCELAMEHAARLSTSLPPLN